MVGQKDRFVWWERLPYEHKFPTSLHWLRGDGKTLCGRGVPVHAYHTNEVGDMHLCRHCLIARDK